MARTALTVQTTNRTAGSCSISWTAANYTNQHSFDNTTEKVILLLKNTHTAAHTVTIKRPATVDGTAIGDLSVSVPANTGEVVLGPFPASLYNQADSGNSLTSAVLVDAPATPTNLSLAVLKLGSLT